MMSKKQKEKDHDVISFPLSIFNFHVHHRSFFVVGLRIYWKPSSRCYSFVDWLIALL